MDPAAPRAALEGSVFAPRLGLHVHASAREGALVAVAIRREAAASPAPDALRPLLARIADHCATGRGALEEIPVALDALSAFDRNVLATLAREVPPGRVVTYAELARLAGHGPGAARAVGAAMARNPLPIVVPCHRVVPAGNRIGNYSGEGGWETKMKLLAIEGARGVWAQAHL